MATVTSDDIRNVREHFSQLGYAVIPNLVDRATIADLKAGVHRMLANERQHPFVTCDGLQYQAMTATAANTVLS